MSLAAPSLPIPPAAPSGGGGDGLLASKRYAPGVVAQYTTAVATLAALDSANLNTGNFTAPASGQVWVEMTLLVLANTAGSGAAVSLALFDHGALVTQRGDTHYFDVNTPAGAWPVTFKWLVTGLTPGNQYNFDLAWAESGSVTITARAGGLTGAGIASMPGSAAVPFLSEVRAA